MKILKISFLAVGLFLGKSAFGTAPDTLIIVESTQPDWIAGTIDSLDASSAILRLDTVRTYHFNFTNCGKTGTLGPSQAACNSAYAGTDLNGTVTVVDSGLQLWQTPEAGIYRMLVAGAGHNADSFIRGAIIRADFELAKSTSFDILVAQMGGSDRGGSGGTFVTYADTTPLIIAGGAGGKRAYSDAGNRGSTSTSGVTVSGPGCSAVGGTAGDGGQSLGGGICSGAGAGLLGDGQGCGGGKAFIHYGSGGIAALDLGGYGGGGGCSGSSSPGGGGGYSGGSVHYASPGTSSCAGGGGSYIDSLGFNVATSDGNYNGKNTFNGDTIGSFNDWHIGHGIVSIDASQYKTAGDRTSPVFDISGGGYLLISSHVDWIADVFNGTAFTVETRFSLDGGSVWSNWTAVANSGDSVPGFTPGTPLDNARIQTKVTMGTTALFASPQLHYLAVTVERDDVTNLAKLEKSLYQFKIYPNPFGHTFKVNYSLSRSSTVGLRLVSMPGQIVLAQESASESAGQHSVDINTSDLHLAPGAYYIELLVGGKVMREKIMHY